MKLPQMTKEERQKLRKALRLAKKNGTLESREVWDTLVRTPEAYDIYKKVKFARG